MEKVLNIKSLGNLNRQFVSLLRSEQDASRPAIGDPEGWRTVLGDEAHLTTLEHAFGKISATQTNTIIRKRAFPIRSTLRWAWSNPTVLWPALLLCAETVWSYARRGLCPTPSGHKNT